MEFLRPILVKIELIYQQPAMTMPFGVIRPFTECLLGTHPVHSDFRLSETVDCYVSNLTNSVILSHLNDEIEIVAIPRSTLYNDGNLIIILSAFFWQKVNGKKD